MKNLGHNNLFLCAVLLCAFSLSSFTSLQAQITHNSLGQLDQNATDILKKASARFQQNVAFNVTATILDGNKKQLAKQTAQVRYNKGKYHLIMEGQELISDGSVVWQWNKQANEVAINNLSSDDIDLLNPGRLLENYQRSFKAKYIRTDDDGTAVIDLTPRSTRSYHKIRLFIKEDDGLLRRIEVQKYDSGREIYDISDFKRASNAASQFTFDPAKHPGVEVIDMR